MAKERLSKLQRWILERCYKNRSNEIWRSEILLFFGTEHPYTSRSIFLSSNSKNKAEVSITNSLKNLFKKGYVDLALGYCGGWYSLDGSEEAIRTGKKDIKKVEDTGKPILVGFKQIPYYAEDIRKRIVAIKKEVKEGVLRVQ